MFDSQKQLWQNRIDQSKRFHAALVRTASELQDRVVAFLSENPPTVESASKAQAAVNLSAEIQRQLNAVGYEGQIRDFVAGYDQAFDAAAGTLHEMGIKDPVRLAGVDRKALEALKRQDYQYLSAIGDQAVQEVATQVMQNTLTGQPRAKMIGGIKGAIDNNLARFASTYADTAIVSYDRQVLLDTWQEAGLEEFTFAGPADIKNRPFCRQHVGKMFTLDEIRAMDNGTRGVGGSPSPMSDAWRFGGGWNCRHVWVPVPPEKAHRIKPKSAAAKVVNFAAREAVSQAVMYLAIQTARAMVGQTYWAIAQTAYAAAVEQARKFLALQAGKAITAIGVEDAAAVVLDKAVNLKVIDIATAKAIAKPPVMPPIPPAAGGNVIPFPKVAEYPAKEMEVYWQKVAGLPADKSSYAIFVQKTQGMLKDVGKIAKDFVEDEVGTFSLDPNVIKTLQIEQKLIKVSEKAAKYVGQEVPAAIMAEQEVVTQEWQAWIAGLPKPPSAESLKGWGKIGEESIRKWVKQHLPGEALSEAQVDEWIGDYLKGYTLETNLWHKAAENLGLDIADAAKNVEAAAKAVAIGNKGLTAAEIAGDAAKIKDAQQALDAALKIQKGAIQKLTDLQALRVKVLEQTPEYAEALAAYQKELEYLGVNAKYWEQQELTPEIKSILEVNKQKVDDVKKQIHELAKAYVPEVPDAVPVAPVSAAVPKYAETLEGYSATFNNWSKSAANLQDAIAKEKNPADLGVLKQQFKELTGLAKQNLDKIKAGLSPADAVLADGISWDAEVAKITAPANSAPAAEDWVDKLGLRYKNAGVGLRGAHRKEIWTDKDGHDWLFKPSPSGEEYLARVDEAAYQVGRLLNPDAVEVRAAQLTRNWRTQTGSLQKMVSNLAGEDGHIFTDLKKLTPGQVEQIQREQVIDYLIANHDNHEDQFLLRSDGHIFGIDKTQAFKYLRKNVPEWQRSKLALDYEPNKKYGTREPIYNRLFRMIKKGQTTFDPNATLPWIQRAEAISDAEYISAIAPYATRLPAGTDVAEFYKLALERKANLRADFEAFYSDVLGKPFKFSRTPAEVQAAKAARAQQKGPFRFITKDDVKTIEQARAAGWQGKALKIDADEIEDQAVLVYTERALDGSERTVLRFKMRKDAGLNLENRLTVVPPSVATVPSIPKSSTVSFTLSESEWKDFEFILTAMESSEEGAKFLEAIKSIQKAIPQFGGVVNVDQKTLSEMATVMKGYWWKDVSPTAKDITDAIEKLLDTVPPAGLPLKVASATQSYTWDATQQVYIKAWDHSLWSAEEIKGWLANKTVEPVAPTAPPVWTKPPDSVLPGLPKPKSAISDEALKAWLKTGVVPKSAKTGGKFTAQQIAAIEQEGKDFKQAYNKALYARRKAKAAAQEPAPAYTVTWNKKTLAEPKTIKDGMITVTGQPEPLKDILEASTRQFSQPQANILFEDGVRMTYSPWGNDDLSYTLRGMAEVQISGPATPQAIDNALRNVASLGVNTQAATALDGEAMYLTKQAYVTNTHLTAEWKALMSALDARNASQADRVLEMRKFWARKLGVSDMAELPGYQPDGRYQGLWNKPGEAGNRLQFRFDVSREEFDREMANYELFHDVWAYQQGDYTTLAKEMMPNDGALLSMQERVRIGVPVSRNTATSLESDYEGGAANYTFARIVRRAERKQGLFFKKDRLLRLDAISYDSDKYGKVTDDFVEKHRKWTLNQWKYDVAPNAGNETIFKNSLTILDDLDQWVIPDKHERDGVLKAFRDAGYTHVSDGRVIDEVVVPVRGMTAATVAPTDQQIVVHLSQWETKSLKNAYKTAKEAGFADQVGLTPDELEALHLEMKSVYNNNKAGGEIFLQKSSAQKTLEVINALDPGGYTTSAMEDLKAKLEGALGIDPYSLDSILADTPATTGGKIAGKMAQPIKPPKGMALKYKYVQGPNVGEYTEYTWNPEQGVYIETTPLVPKHEGVFTPDDLEQVLKNYPEKLTIVEAAPSVAKVTKLAGENTAMLPLSDAELEQLKITMQWVAEKNPTSGDPDFFMGMASQALGSTSKLTGSNEGLALGDYQTHKFKNGLLDALEKYDEWGPAANVKKATIEKVLNQVDEAEALLTEVPTPSVTSLKGIEPQEWHSLKNALDAQHTLWEVKGAETAPFEMDDVKKLASMFGESAQIKAPLIGTIGVTEKAALEEVLAAASAHDLALYGVDDALLAKLEKAGVKVPKFGVTPTVASANPTLIMTLPKNVETIDKALWDAVHVLFEMDESSSTEQAGIIQNFMDQTLKKFLGSKQPYAQFEVKPHEKKAITDALNLYLEGPGAHLPNTKKKAINWFVNELS